MKKIIKPLIALGCFLASIFVAMPIANAVQNDFGNVNVSIGPFWGFNYKQSVNL